MMMQLIEKRHIPFRCYIQTSRCAARCHFWISIGKSTLLVYIYYGAIFIIYLHSSASLPASFPPAADNPGYLLG
jgi:hypothetical protein